jgi:hypothetical protein
MIANKFILSNITINSEALPMESELENIILVLSANKVGLDITLII